MGNLNRSQVIVIVVILIGIVIGIYLVGQRQIFKPKADTDIQTQDLALPSAPTEQITPPPAASPNSDAVSQ